ncbi:MAG: hypothetical protein H7Z75_04275 [Ferruginibacter sp.]|nr:hypothetical protein [Cytophagales bacterium]
MNFNKDKDDIAITIPGFRMRKGADFLGRNEIGIVTLAVDASGTANPTPTLFTNSFFIPQVKQWTWVKFGGHGRIVYGPKNPGSFVYYSVLFVESDQDVREFGETVTSLFDSPEAKEIVRTLTTPHPTALLVSTVLTELGRLVGKILSKNQNDLVYSTEGSFFRNTLPPYNIDDEFSTEGEHIECQIRVIPLGPEAEGRVAGSQPGSFAERDAPAAETLTDSSTPLALEKLAGVPKALKFLAGQ